MCNRQKQLTSSKEDAADFWPSFGVGRKWKRTLTIGRHLSSETLLACSYEKRICQPTKHAASAESALSRLNPSACVCLQLVPGLVARTIVFYRFLFCNHTHFGFVLLDFPLCRSVSPFPLPGRFVIVFDACVAEYPHELPSFLVCRWFGATPQFRVFCRFSILSSDASTSWVASKELLVSGKVTRVWMNNFLPDQFLLDSALFDFLLYPTVLLLQCSTECSAQLFGLQLFHSFCVIQKNFRIAIFAIVAHVSVKQHLARIPRLVLNRRSLVYLKSTLHVCTKNLLTGN